MFTQCRGCGEIFELQADDLVIARGRVRCNVCGQVFDALDTLSEVIPAEDEDLFLHQSESAPPLLTRSLVMDELIQDELQEPEFLKNKTRSDMPSYGSVKSNTFDSQNTTTNYLNDTQEESLYLQDEPNSDHVSVESKSNRLLWSSLSVAAMLLLGWQSIAAIRKGTLTFLGKGVSEYVCQWSDCTGVKEPIDLQSISLVSRAIRPHPGQDRALIISASMTNGNADNKSFPGLEIILSDLTGRPIAMRRFQPKEYLSEEILKTGFVGNTLIPINLEINSPGDDAVAFEIDFIQP